MSHCITEIARMIRYAINTWQRTLCLATLLVIVTIPIMAFASEGGHLKVPVGRNTCADPAGT